MAGRRGRLAAGLAVALLILWVLAGWGVFAPVDAPVYAWTVSTRVRGTSILASWLVILEMALLAGAFAAVYRRQAGLLLRLATLAGAVAAAVWLLKHAGEAWPGWAGNNFPSGHTAGGALAALVWWLALDGWPLRPGPRRALRAAAGGLALLFGVLALYPMGHTPIEVLGAYLLAGAAACFAAAWLATAPPPALPAFLRGGGLGE